MQRCAAVLIAVLACSLFLTSLAAAEGPVGGTLTGILTAKGDDWIEVKADGADGAVRYWPFWRGGNDGGFDQDMLSAIRKLVVPNRVELTWKMEERPRIVSVRMLVPEEKEGTLTGLLTGRGEVWIEVSSEAGVLQRFWPRWLDGAPNQGGGFDRDMLNAFAALRVGERVTVKWTYDERLRAVEVGPAA